MSCSEDFYLIPTEKGTVRSTFANFATIAEKDPYLKGKITRSSFDNHIYLTGFHWNIAKHSANDVDISWIRKHYSRVYQIDNEKNVYAAICMVAEQHTFHPVCDLLNSLQWDGVPRIRRLLPKYLGAEESDLTEAVTLLMLHGAIQRVFKPGCKFDYCIVLQGGQGCGKSTIVRFLALRDEWFCDSLNDMGKLKEAYETICGHWVVELGEMLVTRKTKELESIKSYLSRQRDTYRTPYDKIAQDYPRQCIFIGTSNKPQMLPADMTGNRRFIPIVCDASKAEAHPLDNEAETREFIRQCYAEAIAIGKASGWQLVLDRKFDDELNAAREAATPDDTRIGVIQEWLNVNTKINAVCTRMIYFEVLKGIEEPSRFITDDISDIMNMHISGWRKYVSKSGKGDYKRIPDYNGRHYGSQRAWVRIVNEDANGFMPVDSNTPIQTPYDEVR